MTGLSLPVLNLIPNEPRHDKTCLWGFRQGSGTNWAVQPQKNVRLDVLD